MFFVQTNHTRKELLFLMFKEINLRNHSSLHKLFYSLELLEYYRFNNLKSLLQDIYVKLNSISLLDLNVKEIVEKKFNSEY